MSFITKHNCNFISFKLFKQSKFIVPKEENIKKLNNLFLFSGSKPGSGELRLPSDREDTDASADYDNCSVISNISDCTSIYDDCKYELGMCFSLMRLVHKIPA